MRFASGTPLAGRYLLLDEIAAGPQVAVWRGMDDVLGRPVAVKVYLGAINDNRARAWIHARARTAARLNHPHATAVYDFGDAAGDGALIPYVVMELLDGQPLADRIATGGPLPWPQGTRVAAEVAAALAAAHARGVVHGQVGTGAVMLTRTGAKLLGLAGPGWPPAVEPDRATDVYGLGLLLLDTLCGLDAPQSRAAPLLAAVAGLPDAVAETCLACLAGEAMNGGRSMDEVARALATEVNRYAAEMPDAPPLVPVPSEPRHAARPPRRWPTRVHTGIAAAGVTAVLVASGVAVRYGGGLFAAVTGSPAPGGSSATAGRQPGVSQARPGTTAGGTIQGTTGPGGVTQSGAPGNTPGAGPSSTPDPGTTPTALPPAAAEALTELRASVDDGRTAGEIDPEVATQLDNAIDELVRDVNEHESIKGKVTGLHQRIDAWVKSHTITVTRGADLQTRLDAFAETV